MLLRRLLGDALRRQRLRQERTLRDVSADARVSLGYLSEVERGQKEASSELLSSICEALGVNLSQLLREVSDELQTFEAAAGAASGPALVPMSAEGEPVPNQACTVLGTADRDVVAAA
jgi:transcriptional regulator with XRE-family HTH domain